MVFLSLTVYRVLLLGVLVVGGPWWLLRMLTKGRYRAGLAGRLGFVPRHLHVACRQEAPRGWLWLHAVSVGEVLAASGVVAGLEEAGYRVAVSTTTEAGQKLAKSRFVGSPVFYMPIDFGLLVGRYLRVIRPRLAITMESELWPNLIDACMRRGIPLTVVNARISDRSFPRYRRLRAVWRPLLRQVSLFLAQSDETAERLHAMGVAADRVQVTGNLKFDVRAKSRTALTERVANLLGPAKIVVAGSTLPGEEDALLAAWPGVREAMPDAVLLLAPRHLDRVEEVLGLIEQRGFRAIRCSWIEEASPNGAVLLLDTIGDLASMYSIATVAFVGGSLVPKGGHNPLEPAQFGVPVIMGESFHNFREIVAAMLAGGGLRIVQRADLQGALVDLLHDDRGLGERGRLVFKAQSGATGRTLAALLALVEGSR